MRAEPILERDQELTHVEEALERAGHGLGTVIVVEGEPGIGKSALLRAAAAEAQQRGHQVLAAHASTLERDLPFGVAHQLVHPRGVPDVEMRAVPAGHEGLRPITRLFGRLGELLDAAGPMLILVDDAQSIDEDSARFLAHTALRSARLPITLVVATRAGERGWGRDLVARLLALPGTIRMSPRPLSLQAARDLVGRHLGEAAALLAPDFVRATGGNPFYLRELLTAVADDDRPPSSARLSELVPPAVLHSVATRLAHLGPAETGLARAVAVLGADASLRLAAELAELKESVAALAADRLAGAGILRPTGPLCFACPMLSSVVIADMGHFAAGREHRRAAELLLAHGASDDRVATHLLEAPPAGVAHHVAVLEASGRRAAEQGDTARSQRLLRRALAEPPERSARARILLALVQAEAMSDSPTATEQLEAAAAELGAGPARTEVMTQLATLHHHRGDFARAAELAARAAADLGTEDEPARERLVGIQLAARLLRSGPVPEVAAAFEPLVRACRSGDLPADPGLLSLLSGWLGVEGEPGLVRRVAQAAIARDPLIDGSRGASVGWVATALIYTDELELVERWLSDALAVARQRGEVLAAAIAARNRAVVRYHLGKLEPAITDAQVAVDSDRRGWTGSPFSTPVLVDAHVARGDVQQAARALKVGERAGRDAPDYALLVEARARLRLLQGEPEAALADATSVGSADATRYGVARVWSWRTLAAQAAHRLGRLEEAEAFVEPQLAALRRLGPARQLGAALTVSSLLHDGAEAIALLEEAMTALERSPARLQRCETRLELGAALRRAGESGRASETLLTALDDAAQLGAAPLVARARAELRCLGRRPRRTSRTGAGALTPSERRVADLAATGRSNPQIAAELHLSRSTVETHLRNAYRKLEISSRTQLAAALIGSAPIG